MKAWVNKKKFLSLDLKIESRRSELFVTASSRQTVLKIEKHAWKSLYWASSGIADERKVRLQKRSVPRKEVAFGHFLNRRS